MVAVFSAKRDEDTRRVLLGGIDKLGEQMKALGLCFRTTLFQIRSLKYLERLRSH